MTSVDSAASAPVNTKRPKGPSPLRRRAWAGRLFVAPNLAAKPDTILFNKVTIKGAKQAVQMFGPAQAAVARAVVDSVESGVIPKDKADDYVIMVGVFIHWDASDDKKIYDYNYQATKESIQRALAHKPSVQDVIAASKTAKHPFSPK